MGNVSMIRILFSLIFLVVLSTTVRPQGYVVEISGTWKKSDGTDVRSRQRLGAGVVVNNVSGQPQDAIFIADEEAEVKSCSNGCKSIVTPTESWTHYFRCRIFSCGSQKYIISASKGGECHTLDTIVFIDRAGKTDLSPLLTRSAGATGEVVLRFQRKRAKKIIELRQTIQLADPKTQSLEPGFYDVVYEAKNIRVLVLPVEVYEREERNYAAVREQVTRWKEQGLSECTIRTFILSYLDHVFTEIKKAEKKKKGR